jgi:hypothetical protein
MIVLKSFLVLALTCWIVYRIFTIAKHIKEGK